LKVKAGSSHSKPFLAVDFDCFGGRGVAIPRLVQIDKNKVITISCRSPVRSQRSKRPHCWIFDFPPLFCPDLTARMEQGADYELVTSPKAGAQPAPAPSAATPIEASVGAAATAVPAAQPATTIVDSGEKRSDAARAAFEKGDAQLSKAVHEAKKVNVEDHGGQAADYVKSLIFGGLGE
jgi:hypothetical protein